MLAFALRADGWYLRQNIIWSKPNPMPESVTDRCTKAHEDLFLLTKSARYFYDADAIAEPAVGGARGSAFDDPSVVRGGSNGKTEAMDVRNAFRAITETRNKRSVWSIASEPYREAHFATFPTALVEPCILAGSRVGDTILDPFSGSGTTGVVALKNQRSYLGIELNPAYVAMSRRRLVGVAPLLATEDGAA
jgi:DNA modification methylase